MSDPLLPVRVSVSAKREADVAKDRHLSTSTERHERWLTRSAWVRYPVAWIAGIIWGELSVLLGLRIGQLILSSTPPDETTVAGIFAAWMAFTTGIFRVLRPLILDRKPPPAGADGNDPPPHPRHEEIPDSSLGSELTTTLSFIAARGAPVSNADVAEFLNVSALRTEYYLDKLQDADLIIEEYADHYSLRPRGRAHIVEHHLDR